jgi:3-hydroxybutyryl-CoA dehydrogenase
MKAAVVGAGLMGAEIALVFALAGHDVLLSDLSDEVLDRAMTRLGSLVEKGISRQLYKDGGAREALTRITPTTDIADLADRDLVTEAVFEALDAKVSVLKRLDTICAPHCILTSNTSTLPISTLAAALQPERRPRFIGTHYFSPVSRMQLVEIIPAFATDRGTVQQVSAWLEGADKQPVEIKDVAGFAVNRMLHAFLIEAIRLVEEGVATPADLDTACRLGLGHPIGPFAMMDLVTSDLCVQVQDILHEAYGERFRAPALLRQRVAAGLGGGKGRPGWVQNG